MSPFESKLPADAFRHPESPLRASGHLRVSTAPWHEIHWADHGNPAGEPVLFVHGGPGTGTEPAMARVFDPARYRVILFDQRGCGQSRPHAADDPAAALLHNTTPHLIADMVALTKHLGVQRPLIVFGGSWGSTLAIAFAITHPELVARLVLRGVFLCRRQDLDYIYQGNAATHRCAPFDMTAPGAHLHFPQAWRSFVEQVPTDERVDMVKAYAHILASTPSNDDARHALDRAALAWSIWEGTTNHLAQDLTHVGKFAGLRFARACARIETHYFMNGAFLGGAGEANRGQNHLIEQIDRIRHIPVHIVHGRYDLVCPLLQAEALVAALIAAGAPRPDYRITPAGHALRERQNYAALVDIMDGLPRG